jgi:RHS repeat-associated protein
MQATEPIYGLTPKTMGKGNPLRFSTKYMDDESELSYYGYRYYNIATGRWSSRDPLEEAAASARNLYGFNQNDPVDFWDLLGLLKVGDKFEIKVDNRKVGVAEVRKYQKSYSTDYNIYRGATLRIKPIIDDCCGGEFKWRQRYTEKKDDRVTASNVLDVIKGAKADWYAIYEDEDDCSYTFVDSPRQVMPTWEVTGAPRKVEVSFELELVQVKKGARSGGKVVLKLNWGFWFTKDQHDLINNN